MINQIFLNLPVKNLDKSMAFFKKLGFTFNKEFTDKNAACMVMGNNIYTMLLVEKFFKTFTKKKIADTKKDIEGLFAISVESRNKVDILMAKALRMGGKEPRPTSNHGWMYSRTLEDLDGHTWEIMYFDEKKRK
jgi:predicted lactoylglutathione lyase